MITYRQPFRGEYPITQMYGETVTDPNGHTGIDYACPIGTKILASADGVVNAAGWDSTGYGWRVIIRHTGGIKTLYAHLRTICVQVGQTVYQGDVIALSGYSGKVIPEGEKGAHLHFEARDANGKHFDPMKLPLMSVDDSIVQQDPDPDPDHPDIPEGKCQIICDAAFYRSWDSLTRKELVYRGDLVYVFPDVKYYNGLPFRYIGAGLCIAEYDNEGTQILGVYDGE